MNLEVTNRQWSPDANAWRFNIMGYADIILLFLVIISFVIIDAAIIMKKVSNRNAYREGWDDCYLALYQRVLYIYTC